jgi:hypothetical protein
LTFERLLFLYPFTAPGRLVAPRTDPTPGKLPERPCAASEPEPKPIPPVRPETVPRGLMKNNNWIGFTEI